MCRQICRRCKERLSGALAISAAKKRVCNQTSAMTDLEFEQRNIKIEGTRGELPSEGNHGPLKQEKEVEWHPHP